MGYVDEVLADSPVAYWRLGEPSGTNANDEIGTADGTYQNGPTLGVAGAPSVGSNTAVDFDSSSSQYVSLAAAPDLGGGALTAEAWINPSGVVADQLLFGFYDASFVGWGFNYNGLGLRLWSWTGAAGSWTDSAGVVTANVWSHVAVTLTSGGAVTFYINGSAAGTGTTVLPGSNTGAKSLMRAHPGGNHYDGIADELAIYPTALTFTRIAAHFNATESLPTAEAFVANIPLVGGSSFAPGLSGPGTDYVGDMR